MSDLSDAELTGVILKVFPFVASSYIKIARAAIAADRARQAEIRFIVADEPWLKAEDVQARLSQP